jgi:AAA ATPase domain
MLYGRETERAVIDSLIAKARSEQSGVLLLLGDAGVGKTALLEDACEQAVGMTVLSASGIESEARLPYAGLHQLLRPVLSLVDRIPEPQARALRGALGLEEGSTGESFLVSLAVLSLLAEAAEEEPVLCVVDDAHWLDDASADSLVFAARRIEAERLAMLFAAREEETRSFEAPGLPVLRLGGLAPDAARALLDSRVGAAVSTETRERLIDGTGGNPLALLELSAALDEPQLAGLAPLPVSGSIIRAYRSRIERLPGRTRTVLLVAAADDTRSTATVLRAAARLGAGADALDAAEEADLVQVRDAQIEFRHPLIRSAVYQAAPPVAALPMGRSPTCWTLRPTPTGGRGIGPQRAWNRTPPPRTIWSTRHYARTGAADSSQRRWHSSARRNCLRTLGSASDCSATPSMRHGSPDGSRGPYSWSRRLGRWPPTRPSGLRSTGGVA